MQVAVDRLDAAKLISVYEIIGMSKFQRIQGHNNFDVLIMSLAALAVVSVVKLVSTRSLCVFQRNIKFPSHFFLLGLFIFFLTYHYSYVKRTGLLN